MATLTGTELDRARSVVSGLMSAARKSGVNFSLPKGMTSEAPKPVQGSYQGRDSVPKDAEVSPRDPQVQAAVRTFRERSPGRELSFNTPFGEGREKNGLMLVREDNPKRPAYDQWIQSASTQALYSVYEKTAAKASGFSGDETAMRVGFMLSRKGNDRKIEALRQEIGVKEPFRGDSDRLPDGPFAQALTRRLKTKDFSFIRNRVASVSGVREDQIPRVTDAASQDSFRRGAFAIRAELERRGQSVSQERVEARNTGPASWLVADSEKVGNALSQSGRSQKPPARSQRRDGGLDM